MIPHVTSTDDLTSRLLKGLVIPACPLVLDQQRQFDERRQRALIRYYHAAGAGGLAACVHTTQFEIRESGVNLYEPVLNLIQEELDSLDNATGARTVRIAGVCGDTSAAVAEAGTAANHQYDAALLNLAALRGRSIDELIDHCRAVAEVLPLFGFYLQEDCGGIPLPFEFWKKLCELPRLVGIKIAAFDRYRTLDVLRAVAESGREDIAIYTGNDDNIIADLLTPFRFQVRGEEVIIPIVGGLLGQWAVWTKRAVDILDRCRAIREGAGECLREMLSTGVELTDANSVIFDSAHRFRGCIPGIHYVLSQQGFFDGIWLLDEQASLSPGQQAEIDRVSTAYPHLTDDEFVRQHLDEWLR